MNSFCDFAFSLRSVFLFLLSQAPRSQALVEHEHSRVDSARSGASMCFLAVVGRGTYILCQLQLQLCPTFHSATFSRSGAFLKIVRNFLSESWLICLRVLTYSATSLVSRPTLCPRSCSVSAWLLIVVCICCACTHT